MQNLEHWPLTKLVEYARNPRKNDHAVDKVAAAIREFGFRVPIVAKSDGTIVDGHLRFKAARKLNLDTVPVLLADDMTPEQVKAFRISVNKVAELAEWDDELLQLEISELRDAEFDLSIIGFDDGELDRLLASMEAESQGIQGDEDDAPEVQAQAVTVRGDVWLCGRHRVMCGDSTVVTDVERLMKDQKAELCFTSPPYASQRKYDESSEFKPITPDDYGSWWHKIQDSVSSVLQSNGSFIVNIKEHSENGQKHTYVKRLVIAMVDDYRWRWIDEYAWLRVGVPGGPENMGRFRNAWESVYWFSKGKPLFYPKNVMIKSENAFDYKSQKAANKKIGAINQGRGSGTNQPVGVGDGLAYPSNVIDIKNNAEILNHPAAFPVQLPTFFIEANSNVNGIIFEPFGGSGTTLIACEKTSRTARLMELSPAYVDVIVRRWQTATGKQATLESTGQTFADVEAERL